MSEKPTIILKVREETYGGMLQRMAKEV